MNRIYALALAVLLGLLGFAAGYHSAPEKIKIETRIVDVEKHDKVKESERERQKHKETRVVEAVKLDGTKEITTIIVEDIKTDSKINSTDTTIINRDTQSVSETSRHSPTTFSVLLGTGYRPSFISAGHVGQLMYGGHISRPLIGPVTGGVFGLSSGVYGISLGLSL